MSVRRRRRSNLQILFDVIFDSFDRANGVLGTSDTGQVWTDLHGTFGVATNQSKVNVDAGDNKNVTVIDAGFADGRIAHQIDIASQRRVFARVIDFNNAFMGETNGGIANLYILTSGTYTSLGSAAVTQATGSRLVIVLSGTNISLKHNDTLVVGPVVNAQGSAITKHGHGHAGASVSSDNWCAAPTNILAFTSGRQPNNTVLSPNIADTGHIIQTHNGVATVWGYNNNKFYVSAASGYGLLSLPGNANGSIEAQTTITGASVGLACRILTDNDFLFTDYDNTKFVLIKRIIGVFTSIANGIPSSGGNKQKIAFNGSAITVTVDDVLVISVSETAQITNTLHGLSSASTALTAWNLKVK